MKKIFLIFLFFGLCLNSVFSMENGPAKSVQILEEKLEKLENETGFQKFKSHLFAVPEKFSKISSKISTTFNWVADRIDTILTKKGAIKTLLILGPLFTAYCYFFPPAPVQSLIKYIVGSAAQGASEIANSVAESINNNDSNVTLALGKITKQLGQFQGVYNANQEIGHTSGFWQGMWNSPWATIGMVVGNGIEKGISIGVPFILGLILQNKLKLNDVSKTQIISPINTPIVGTK